MSNQPPGKNEPKFKHFNELATLEFFNLHSKSNEEVIEFCRKYIFPTYSSGDSNTDAVIGKNLYEQALSESKIFNEVANRVIDDSYTDADIEVINQRISKITSKLRIIDRKSLDAIEGNEVLFSKPKEILIKTKVYSNAYPRFWEELVFLLFERQLVKRCANCSVLYIPVKKGNNKFCTPGCKSAYSKRKKRAEALLLSSK